MFRVQFLAVSVMRIAGSLGVLLGLSIWAGTVGAQEILRPCAGEVDQVWVSNPLDKKAALTALSKTFSANLSLDLLKIHDRFQIEIVRIYRQKAKSVAKLSDVKSIDQIEAEGFEARSKTLKKRAEVTKRWRTWYRTRVARILSPNPAELPKLDRCPDDDVSQPQ